MFHRETRLHFTRRAEAGESYKHDCFFIYISSWATQRQMNLAWNVADIARREGWTLEKRTQEEVSDLGASLYHSLRFSMLPSQGERVAFTFYPADAAKFDHTLLKRG